MLGISVLQVSAGFLENMETTTLLQFYVVLSPDPQISTYALSLQNELMSISSTV